MTLQVAARCIGSSLPYIRATCSALDIRGAHATRSSAAPAVAARDAELHPPAARLPRTTRAVATHRSPFAVRSRASRRPDRVRADRHNMRDPRGRESTGDDPDARDRTAVAIPSRERAAPRVDVKVPRPKHHVHASHACAVRVRNADVRQHRWPRLATPAASDSRRHNAHAGDSDAEAPGDDAPARSRYRRCARAADRGVALMPWEFATARLVIARR